MKWITFIVALLTTVSAAQNSRCVSWSVRMADSFMEQHPDSISYPDEPRGAKWTYEMGLILEAMHRMWLDTGDDKYLSYIQKNIDKFVEEGRIRTYEYESFNLDNIAPGRELLMLFARTGKAKYRKAAEELRLQLTHQPRTNEGGFWHKKIYPSQMWLDGLYMAEPFYAEYARMFNERGAFDDIAHQFILIENHTRDPNTGLLYHAWDESRRQRWADSVTGRSPNFWGRAMGWYAMALVDVLDVFPEDHPQRPAIIAILRRLCSALTKYRDPETGLWYQVVDQAAREGNYLESSASCMFVYALAKGSNKGYLDPGLFPIAQESFSGIIKNMVTESQDGTVSLHHSCQVAGLGGNPYRDGSFRYYVSEPQRTNDFKAIAPFIFAALEIEKSDCGKAKDER